MKIGILTYHRTLNYGGCLQALAMRLLLEQLGHEAYYVDYWPRYHQNEYAIFNKNKYNNQTWKGKIGFLLMFSLRYLNIKRRKANFESFLNTYIYPYCRSVEEEYDVIIYGSDQIWRKQAATHAYNPVYFGLNDFRAKKHISFSASMGILPDNEEDKIIIKEYLSHLNAISVRESNLQQFVYSLGYDEVELSLDPTLLLDSSMWSGVFKQCKPISRQYILLYSLWGDAFDMNSIKKLAAKEHLLIVVLKGEAGICDNKKIKTTAGPEEFVSLIKNAKYVFTSSFHGLVFSIIFKKEVFASFLLNGGRAKSLLDSLNLSNRYLEPKIPFSLDFKRIDYNRVYENLVKLKDQSIQYLTENIQ